MAFRCAAARGRRWSASLRRDAARVLELTALDHAELSMVLVDDRAITKLNKQWRRIDEPTDVLSFPQNERKRGARRVIRARDLARGAALGDIVISIDAAARDATLYEIDLRAYLRRLMIHGLLHLLGYDHERSPREARRMFARHRRIEKRFLESRARGAK